MQDENWETYFLNPLLPLIVLILTSLTRAQLCMFKCSVSWDNWFVKQSEALLLLFMSFYSVFIVLYMCISLVCFYWVSLKQLLINNVNKAIKYWELKPVISNYRLITNFFLLCPQATDLGCFSVRFIANYSTVTMAPVPNEWAMMLV